MLSTASSKDDYSAGVESVEPDSAGFREQVPANLLYLRRTLQSFNILY